MKEIENEINYSLKCIKEVPYNESPYNYIRGLIQHYKKSFSSFVIKDLILDNITSNNYYMYSLLLDIYEEENDKNNFEKTIQILINIDNIRKKYWLWRAEYFNR